MAPEQHALLGASSAKQWLGCPPSVRLVESLGLPEETSPYAEEGTAAHALAEAKLLCEHGCGLRLGKRDRFNRLKAARASEWYGPEMEYATDLYVQYVDEVYNSDAGVGVPHLIELECRVYYSEYAPHGFGTADCLLVLGDVLHVIDLKYGKGVEVSAKGNPQLRLYALGALDRYSGVFDIAQVCTHIVQPRLDLASACSYSVEELERWGREYVAPRAVNAWQGLGQYAPGEETCRWCRAKAVCRARADAALKEACADFSVDDVPAVDKLQLALESPGVLTDEETSRLLRVVPVLESWCKDVREHAQKQAQAGVRYPGWKLVEGRSNRKIADADAAMKALAEAGVPAEDYLEPAKLLGITALTKALGKKRFDKIVGPFVVKPAGKPVLVPEEDERPEIGSAQSAAADFS